MANISSRLHIKNRNNKQKFRIFNNAGMTVCFSNYGARITSVKYKGKEVARNGYISGRCANRIAGATFELNGKIYHLDQNEGDNHLHGGYLGFSHKFWSVQNVEDNSITFSLHSPDGDMGYPGNLDISVTYTLTDDKMLIIEFKAKCDQDTILNPINHLFLNSNNNQSELWINAGSYTEKNENKLPTGRILPVNRTIYDFSVLKPTEPEQVYDINYVLNGEGFRKVASLKTKDTCIDVFTDRPGLQLYKSKKHICLEAQIFPDAIHFKHFPSPIIKKDAAFYSKTAYQFKFE